MDKLFELQRALSDKNAAGHKIYADAIAAARNITPEEETRAEGIRGEILEIKRKVKLFEQRDAFVTMSAEERAGQTGVELPNLDGKHAYSLVRALNMQLQVREGKGKYCGLEYEVHTELEKHAERSADGIRIPWNLRNDALANRAREQRDITTSTASGTIANLLGTELIEILRKRMAMQAMGARVLTGLTGGSFSLPKQTAASTAYHVAEAVAPTPSNSTFGTVTWSPRTLGAQVNTSRKALLQTSLDIEAITRLDIMKVLAIEFDRVGINGAGSGAVPMGILQDPSVPTVALGTNGLAPTWAALVGLESQVASSNADFGTMGYVFSAKGRGTLKVTPKIGTTFPIFMWEKGSAPGEGEVNGYRAMASNQVPDVLTKGSGTALTAGIFGNFESATYGLWSGVDIIVDPYSGSSTGAVKIVALQEYDLAFRYEESFAKIVDMINA